MTIARTLIPAVLGTLICADVSAEQERLDEILVTATRRTVSITEVSSGLTLVDGVSARDQKLVTDALAIEVGVYLQQTTPGQGAPIIRGLKGSSILHLVDGMRLNNAIFRSAPKIWPPGMLANAVGRVVKISPGPSAGSRPFANTIGKIITPARIAIRVSALAMITAAFVSEMFFGT